MLESLYATLNQHRRDIVMSVILIILGCAIFEPMMMRWRTMGDYTTHNEVATMAVNDTANFFHNTPHFLYHLTTALVFILIPNIDIPTAGAWVMVICYLALILIIYWQIRHISDLPASIPILLISAIFTMGLVILMPIDIFTPDNLYFGYFAPNVYHNPTVNMTKPFSLVLFFLAAKLFRQKEALKARWIIPFALLSFFSLVAKPNFILAFVPTLALLTGALILWRLVQGLREQQSFITILKRILEKEYINWPILIFGIVAPAFIVLLYQSTTWTSSGGIGIDPFRVFFEWTLHYDKNADKQILFKFVMSCAFPLAVYFLHIKSTYRNLTFNLAWMHFLVSVAYAYLLVDYTSIAAGDFGWSAQIAAFILYIVATLFFLKRYLPVLAGEKLKPVQWFIVIVCVSIFALHVISGIHWYQLHFTQEMSDLIYIWW